MDLVVSIEKLNANDEVNPYPNPAQTVLNFSIPLAYQKSNIILTDLSGKVVYTEQIEVKRAHQIDVSRLPAGMYVLTVNSAAFSYTHKVVIE